MVGFVCCAFTASAQTAAPPSPAMNSRRRRSPEEPPDAHLRKAERAKRFARSYVKLHQHNLPNSHTGSEQGHR
jgi:hypothetical protein